MQSQIASGCAKAKISATLISTVLHFKIVATFPASVVLLILLFRKVLKGLESLVVEVPSYLVILLSFVILQYIRHQPQ
jgi:hypothetical protein